MRVLLTGATGLIGGRLAELLLEQGYQVNALVRSQNKLKKEVQENSSVFQGDILDKESIGRAMKNCEAVFHLAAFAGIWSKDKMLPYKVNVNGTKNILDAALKYKVRKVVFTSSAGTLSPSNDTDPVDENSPLPETYHTDYEVSKRQAEELCMEYNRLGLKTVVVNPTRVFGPGPLNKSNSVAVIIKKYLSGRWRFVPGNGKSTGNYAFIDDVAAGHIQALKLGTPGEKYILGGANASFNEFFSQLSKVSRKKHRLFHIPFPLIDLFAESEQFFAEVFGKTPVITPPWAKRYRQNRLVSSRKAITELDYKITILPQALRKTIDWLESSGK
jgi:NAD+-dependent farnesol dehydrogenase